MIGNIVIGKGRSTRGGNSIGTYSFTRGTAIGDVQQREDCLPRVAVCQACKSYGVGRVGSAIGLALVVHRHRQVGLGDFKVTGGVAHAVVALFCSTGRCDDVVTHSLTGGTAQCASNEAG